GVDILATRRRDNHLFGAAAQVGAGFFLTGEETGALEHHIDIQLAPGQSGRVAVGQHADTIAIDDHVVAVDLYRAWELAMSRVKTRQVRVGLRVAQVVDGHDLDVVFLAAFVKGPQNITADTAVTVDRHTYGH